MVYITVGVYTGYKKVIALPAVILHFLEAVVGVKQAIALFFNINKVIQDLFSFLHTYAQLFYPREGIKKLYG